MSRAPISPCAALLCCAIAAHAESRFASPGYAAGALRSLNQPLYAQSAALSGTVTASVENLAGLEVNPAVLDALELNNAYIGGSFRFLTLSRRNWGVQAAFSAGDYVAVGMSAENFTVDEIDGRDSFGNHTGNFDYREGAIGIAAAGRILWDISLGAKINYLYGAMDNENGNGLSADIGLTRSLGNHLRLGMSARHLLSSIWWTTGHRDRVLPSLQVGAAGIFFGNNLTAEFDLGKTSRQPVDLSAGVQYRLMKFIYLRAGAATAVGASGRGVRNPDFSLGGGMLHNEYGFDYSLEIPSSRLGPRHTLSISRQFIHNLPFFESSK